MEFVAKVARRNGIMTMAEFEVVSARKQVAFLYEDGVYIGKCKTSDYVKLLFQLNSFYVEIVYASYRLAIKKIRCSDCTTILDEYLGQIDVEYLVG